MKIIQYKVDNRCDIRDIARDVARAFDYEGNYDLFNIQLSLDEQSVEFNVVNISELHDIIFHNISYSFQIEGGMFRRSVIRSLLTSRFITFNDDGVFRIGMIDDDLQKIANLNSYIEGDITHWLISTDVFDIYALP